MRVVAKRGSNSGLLLDSSTLRCAVDGALENRDYERVAELLEEAIRHNKAIGGTVPGQVLDAVRFVCIACSRCETDAGWHNRAKADALDRAHELRQELQVLLEFIGRRSQPPTRQFSAHSRASVMGTHTGGLPAHAAAERTPSLWRRIGAGFGIGPGRSTAVQRLEHPASRASCHPIAVYGLGRFRIFHDHLELKDWTNGKGKSVFKYLVAHRERPVAKEVLMEVFWPGAEPCHARNNLNVAIYHLRQALSKAYSPFSYVLFEDNSYLLSQDFRLWIDFEAFRERIEAAHTFERCGDRLAAIREYRAAETLYQGEFLEEDRYESWLVPLRQRLQDEYMQLLDRLSQHYYEQEDYGSSAELCNKMLAIDACCEEAHRQLMRCYSQQGHCYLALRQFQACAEALQQELELEPSEATKILYRRIRVREAV